MPCILGLEGVFMSKPSHSLQMQQAFYEVPEQRPLPSFFGEESFKRAWDSVKSHSKINQVLDQLWRKDPYTYGHSHRVADYSQMIAAQLGMSAQERVEVYLSGLLHDTGKIMTPDHVLKKPGPLTPEEFTIIRLHPVDSGKIVQNIPDLGYLADAIRGHHERVDGKGYPDQSFGDEIHIYSRIILVADTFDAMTTTRVYRKQLDLDRTYNELNRCSGTQFDPECVKAFIAAHQELVLTQPVEEKEKKAA